MIYNISKTHTTYGNLNAFTGASVMNTLTSIIFFLSLGVTVSNRTLLRSFERFFFFLNCVSFEKKEEEEDRFFGVRKLLELDDNFT